MGDKRIIAVLAVLVFGLWVLPTLGRSENFPVTELDQPEGLAFGSIDLASNVLAQNDNEADDKAENSKSGPEAKGSEEKSESAADGESKSSKAKSKPLKPFVPSEKIPGEQAVDFPVDI